MLPTPHAENPSLREQTLPQLVANAWRLYSGNLAMVVVTAFLATLPLLLLGTVPQEPTPGDALGLGLLMVVIIVCSGVAVTAITLVYLAALAGPALGPGALLRLTFRRSLLSVTVAYLVTNLVSSLGLLLLAIPGLIAGGFLAPTLPAILVEGTTSLRGIARSVALVRRDALKGIAAFAFSALVAEFLPVVIVLGLQVLVGTGPFSGLLAVLVGAVTLPVALAINVTLYCSLRITSGAQPEALRAELLAAVGAAGRPG